MARVFITGSSDGLGLTAAQLLVEEGHIVVLHARSKQRADETQNRFPAAESVVVGDLTSLTWADRPWLGQQAYSDTKLHDVLMAFAIARRWPSVLSNALEPGWVPTKMGGSSATDDLDQAHRTQVWLAVSNDPVALVSGEYFYHMEKRHPHPATRDAGFQDRLLDFCSSVTGVELPS